MRILKDISYKKMILLTHESNFMVSVITNLKNYVKPLILSETNDGEITIDNLNYQYEAEVNYYKIYYLILVIISLFHKEY